MYVFEEVALDFITHLPKRERGYDSIITFVHRLSKYIYFVPCTSCIIVLELTYVFQTIVIKKNMVCCGS